MHGKEKIFPKVNKSVSIHHGRVFKLVKEHITLANGVSSEIDIIRHPGASAIIPMSDKNNVILIKQYRHAVGNYLWEIPAGTLNPNESALICAKRELIEETGYSAIAWKKLGEIIPVPGYSNELIHIFLATGLKSAKQNLDFDEILEVHEIKFADALTMIYQGEIQDSKTVCGLFMAAHRLKQKE